MFAIVQGLLIGVEIVLALVVGYLLLLTAAAWLGRPRTPPVTARWQRFVFLIPAYNEERLLPGLLASLRQLDYPRELYEIHVVVDNSTDRTAEVGRAGGAIVHERHNTVERGKPYALRWALQQIAAAGTYYDALVILDADSVVSPNFLTVMNARLSRGERAIQSYYAVRDPGGAWSAGLRAVALTAVHYLRPLGRMVLGGSAGLKGNGMVFAADIVRRQPWPVSLTEDIEYHMQLILAGERVTFAPDALVLAEMPDTLAASQSQNVRWERGRMEMVRRYVPQLLGAALRRRSFLLFDAAVEQLIPPFSLVVALSIGCLLAAAAIQSWLGLLIAGLLIVGQIVYTLSALALAGVSKEVYRSLLFAPFFVVWKIWLYLRVALGFERRGWVRTTRNK